MQQQDSGGHTAASQMSHPNSSEPAAKVKIVISKWVIMKSCNAERQGSGTLTLHWTQ